MQLRYDKEGPIGRITLDNPPYNALVHPVFADLEELQSFLNDTRLKAVIVTGSGRNFSSGADPKSFSKLFEDTQALARALSQSKDILKTLFFAPIPTIAVIKGSCLGAGLEISLACHFRFAAKSALLGFPETDYSLLPGLGGTIFSQEVMRRGPLMDLILSGRMVSAEEALELGLVDRIGTKKEIEQLALEHLNSLTAPHSTKLIRTVMQSLNNGRLLSQQDALEEESRLFCELAQDVASQQSQNKKDSD